MQAKDIPDIEMLRTIDRLSMLSEGWEVFPHWVLTWDFEEHMPEYPLKVIIAKCRKLIRKGLLDGCTCGCRGDFELTVAGTIYLMEHGFSPAVWTV